MIGVTIGIGEGWHECAQWSARRMEDMTGLPCYALDYSSFGIPQDNELVNGILSALHPSWLKHQILQCGSNSDSFLYFDADIICLKLWNPKDIFEKNGRKLCAVRDNNPAMASAVREEEKTIGIPQGTYLNAGLFMFGREHAPVFEATWARRPAWHRWIDQGAWNRALYDLKVPVAVLPNPFNEMNRTADYSSTVNWHCHSLDGDWKQLKKWQDTAEIIQLGACNAPSPSAAPTK